MLELLWIVIIGALVGASAKLVMPGRDPGGLFVTAVLGMAAAVVATLVGRMTGVYEAIQGAGIVASIVGAVILLFTYRQLRRRPADVREPAR